jgi:predicted metal-dependent hydrolase
MLRALFTRQPSPVPPLEIVFDGQAYCVQVKRHRRARRYTLRVQAATREVVLTMPVRGTLRDAKAFAEKSGAWIAARLKRLPQAAPFVHGALAPLRGVSHRIEHRRGARGTVWVEADAHEPCLCVAGDAPHVDRRVADYLKRQAKADLHVACRRYAELLGVSYTRVTVRDTTSRWGSCSSTGALSFSWRLILAPPHVLDYLAAHEIAHLVEMNHSRRFWRILREVCPDMDRAKAWIDAHGSDLHRYGMQ